MEPRFADEVKDVVKLIFVFAGFRDIKNCTPVTGVQCTFIRIPCVAHKVVQRRT
jgi:hypothetical protein